MEILLSFLSGAAVASIVAYLLVRNMNKMAQTNQELAREAMRSQFEKELESRSEALKKANTEQMERVVGPLQKELEGLRTLVTTSKESQDKNLISLEAGIKAVFEHDKERDKTTQSLAEALKNRGKVQGDWGEQVLENILRDSGLREGEEYFTQENIRDNEGNNLRPDVVVKAADGSRIVLDSKVSLTAYTDYVGAESEEKRQEAIRANHDSIWKHVEELANKKYTTLVSGSVPQVLMFVPNEGAYILAMNKDPQLGTKAYRKGVLIVNPTNLMVVLKLILITWQNTRQEKTNRNIIEAATGIYEKYVTFTEEYIKLGDQLGTIQRTYDKSLGQLKEGKGNLSSRMEKLLKMGISSSKQIPENASGVLE